MSAAYTGITNPGTEMYLPLVHRNNSGWYSNIVIMNTGTSATTASIYVDGTFKNSYLISAKGRIDVDTGSLPGGFTIGGAKIVSTGQPLAVVTTQWKKNANSSEITVMDYEGIPSSANPNYFPMLYKANSSWDTGVMLQNASTANNTISVQYYYDEPDGYCCSSYNHTIPGNDVQSIFPLPSPVPSGFIGSGKADGYFNFFSIINQVNLSINNGEAARGVGNGANTVILPVVFNNYGSSWLGKTGWTTGISIQNVGANDANVNVYTYWHTGNSPYSSPQTVSISSGQAYIFYPLTLPSNFYGSAVVVSDQPIAVIANHVVLPTPSQDVFMSHNGVER